MKLAAKAPCRFSQQDQVMHKPELNEFVSLENLAALERVALYALNGVEHIKHTLSLASQSGTASSRT